jgi:hypothetical protein
VFRAPGRDGDGPGVEEHGAVGADVLRGP